MNKTISSYHNFYERVLPTGSRVIIAPEDQKQNPPKDEDYIMLVTLKNAVPFINKLREDGWLIGGSSVTDLPDGTWEKSLNEHHTFTEDGKVDMRDVFVSFKKRQTEERKSALGATYIHQLPELNIILTCNKEYFDDFTRATFLAKALNLTDKQDRVILFEALTRDVWPSGERKEKKSNLLKTMKYALQYETYAGAAGVTATPVSETAPVNWDWASSNLTAAQVMETLAEEGPVQAVNA